MSPYPGPYSVMDGESVDRTCRGLVPGSVSGRFMMIGFNAWAPGMLPNPNDSSNQILKNG